MTTALATHQIKIPPGVIDLGQGDPPFSLLPLDLLRRASESRFAEGDPAFLQYGAEAGDGRFRVALADVLSRGYGLPVPAESLFITNGVSNALDLICSLFARAGDTIFVEEPSYFLALRIFADHGLQVESIATDEHGLVPAALEEALAHRRPKFLYLIPTFQNPTGRTLPPERRQRLVELCQQHGFLLLADEVYQFLSYASKPPDPFAAHTDIENVVSLGSFSKILAPGLRLGWIQAHSKIVTRLEGCGLVDSGGGLGPFISALVCAALENGGLEENIANLVSIYRSKLAVMDEGLRRHLPGVSYAVPEGGYFFWVKLPGAMDASALQKKAERYKVNFRPGIRFSSRSGLRDYARLCFIFYDGEEIEEGLRRLGECLGS